MTERRESKSIHLLENAKQLYHECKFEESEKAFAELAESASQKDVGHYGLGLIRFQRGSFEPAEAEFQKCLKENAANADAYFYLGQICRLRNEPEKAVACWLKSLSLEPKHASANRQLYLLSGSMLARARRLYSQHKFKASGEAFEKVIKLGRHRAEGYYGLGVVFFQLGSFDLAKKQLEACVKIESRHANAWFYLGEIARKRNELEESRRCFKKSLEISPNHAGAKRRLLSLLESNRNMSSPSGTQPVSSAPSAVSAPTSSTGPLPSQGVAQQMQSLRMIAVQPSISAYLGGILLRLVICLGVYVVAALIIEGERPKSDVSYVIVMALLVGYLLWHVFKILSTRITLEQGHLIIAKGISGRLTDVPLVNIQNLEIQQSLLNRITGDGAIVLYLAPGQGQIGNPLPAQVKLLGLAKFTRLTQIIEQMKALIPLLRNAG